MAMVHAFERVSNCGGNLFSSLQCVELEKLPDLEITAVVRKVEPKTSASLVASKSTVMDLNEKKEKIEINSLLRQLPELNKKFKLYNKIGEGTFSTVYLATSKEKTDGRKYAIKHLTQSLQQSRIERELKCMAEIGGKENVVTAEYFFSNGGSCSTFVMPYLPHKRFSDYVLDMDSKETQLYMKNLFIALKRVHSFNVIHRDVKPGNFLYNRESKEFLLVDFGLAQVLSREAVVQSRLDENMPLDYSQKRKRTPSGSEGDSTPGKRIALKTKDVNTRVESPLARVELNSPVKLVEPVVNKTPLKSRQFSPLSHSSSTRKKLFQDDSTSDSSKSRTSLSTSILRAQLESKMQSQSSDRSFTPLVSNRSSLGSFVQIRNSRVIHQQQFFRPSFSACPCAGKGSICNGCAGKSKMMAPRAGTPGFRPPEVLLKYQHQTTAVDMWASGVVLLCILSGSYPFFRAPNDIVALSEIITVFGSSAITQIAAKFGRRVMCTEQRKPMDLKFMCTKLRSRARKKSDVGNKTSSNLGSEFPDSAYHLLSRLLDVNPATRITAAEALQHPFVRNLDK